MFEACKQCERSVVPTCLEPTSLEKVLEEKFDKVIVFAERSTEITLKQYLTQNPIKKGEKVLAIIGPEGGFSQKEFDYFRAKDLPLVSLGDLILIHQLYLVSSN
jgi:16S rRNA (uracil1498-N3)-methyltransferase